MRLQVKLHDVLQLTYILLHNHFKSQDKNVSPYFKWLTLSDPSKKELNETVGVVNFRFALLCTSGLVFCAAFLCLRSFTPS